MACLHMHLVALPTFRVDNSFCIDVYPSSSTLHALFNKRATIRLQNAMSVSNQIQDPRHQTMNHLHHDIGWVLA